MQSTPGAPLDKTGTSMRMLLLDTQTNFENFSGRVDKLIDCVENAKSEVEYMKAMMQAERENAASEMIDLSTWMVCLRCHGHFGAHICA